MINVFNENEISFEDIINREKTDYSYYEASVKEILANVKNNGDKALFFYSEKFDRVKLNSLKVTSAEIEQAYFDSDPAFIAILERAKENIVKYHEKQLRKGFEYKTNDGSILGQRVIPVQRACIYVPGGTAAYPSTVLMDVIPAKIAGVKEIYMTTPPMPDGSINKNVLAAAKIAGINKIYKLGGAQAIAAFAYGTETVPKVDKIVGPGNIYVATAKRMVFGEVSIDMVAGPSEILVVADSGANPKHIAADMLSQAEHDKLASSILVTDSMDLALEVQKETENQLNDLPRKNIASHSLYKNGKIIVAKNISRVIEIANRIAPEHLELAVKNPMDYLEQINNAGSVFLGYNTPEAVGDYYAGANHTLPTGGSARFSSALSVDDFIKKTQYIFYSDDELKKAKNDIIHFAKEEGLTAHARSVSIRFED